MRERPPRPPMQARSPLVRTGPLHDIRRWVLVASVLASLTSTRATANGRFPTAQQLIEDPANPQHLVLRATYGILTSQDGGRSWSWVCEQAVGYGEVEDPALGLMANGSLLAGIFDGMARSRDSGCSWQLAQGAISTEEVIDVTVNPTDRARALALTTELLPSAQFAIRVWETLDNGETWTQLGPAPRGDNIVFAFEAAPSDRGRIYLSALETPAGGVPRGVLLRSDDRGKSWTPWPIPGSDAQNPPFVTAVASTDPDSVYVRLSGTEHDSLLYSADGGRRWRQVIRGRAKLPGFALSPDGSTVLVGFGKRLLPDKPVDCTILGIWMAPTQDFRFRKIFHGAVQCLTWTERGVYACTSQEDHGYALGLSTDRAVTFAPIMQLKGLDGPLACRPGTSVAASCPHAWLRACSTVGKQCPGGTPDASGLGPPAGTPSVICAGSLDAGVDAALPIDAAAGRASAVPPASPDAGPEAAPGDGCGCRLGPVARAPFPSFPLGVIGVAAVLLLRRRRRSPLRAQSD